MTVDDSVTSLVAMDRLVVSVDVFVDVFTPLVDDPFPGLTVKAVAGRLAAQHGIEWKHGRILAGLPSRPREASVLRVALDLVVGWERSSLAARISDSGDDGTTRVVLTVAGERLLRGEHARDELGEVLARHDGRRSFSDV